MRRRDEPEAPKIRSLTKREREIVLLIGEGLRNVAIANQLFISEATVRNHLTSILSKLELSDRFELAVYAFRHGLVAVQTARADRTWTLGMPARRVPTDVGITPVPVPPDFPSGAVVPIAREK
jgi:DNA-binding CsgD family transcriptional regulator